MRSIIKSVPFWSKDGEVEEIELWEKLIDHSAEEVSDPVHTRGWTLEEWLLSPRRLCFTREQVVWLCRGALHTDGGNSGIGLPEVNLFGDAVMGPNKEIDLTDEVWWHYIVRGYTARGLTHERDKLVAITGIAEQLALRTKKTFIAGLWVEDLATDLLWQRTGSSRAELSGRSAAALFPS